MSNKNVYSLLGSEIGVLDHELGVLRQAMEHIRYEDFEIKNEMHEIQILEQIIIHLKKEISKLQTNIAKNMHQFNIDAVVNEIVAEYRRVGELYTKFKRIFEHYHHTLQQKSKHEYQGRDLYKAIQNQYLEIGKIMAGMNDRLFNANNDNMFATEPNELFRMFKKAHSLT